MKHLFKLTLLLALLLPTTATAYDFEVDGIYYNIINSNEAAVTYIYEERSFGYSDYSGNVIIPSSVTHNGTTYSVTSIGSDAFCYSRGLTSVTIPNSVTTIGQGAFSSCSGLASVEIPNSVTTIGYCAFYGCSGLTNVNFGSSVTSIANKAFYLCDGLSSIIVSADNQKYDSRNNCNAIIESVSNTLILGCKNTIVPNSVTSIGSDAFSDCTGLTSINIPNSVTKIDNEAFSGCSGLTNVNIPNSITSIGSYAFSGCIRLNNVYCNITDPSLVNLGNQAFYLNDSWRYALRTLHIPAGSLAAYNSSSWFSYFGNIVEFMPEVILATGISLNQSQMSMVLGSNSQLFATVLPDSTTNKAVTWATSDPSIVTVDNNGILTALSVGSATITAMTADGSNLCASCEVTVTHDLNDYDNYLLMADTTVFHGKTIVIPVKMVNEASIISFQTDIYLPEGLELLQEDGEYLIDPSSRMTSTHNLMSNAVSNGSIRVVCYSANYKPFKGESGDDLFYITVKVADDAEGDYTVRLKNTLFTTNEFEEIAVPDAAATVNVKAFIPGDANDSGNVTVTDVVVASQYILELNPEPFNFTAADVNTDGSITVTDVSRIAWIVLNPTLNAPLRAPALWNNGDLMSGNGITLAAGETRRVSIALDNAMDYNAFQFDLRLPAGLTASNFAVTDRAASHAFDVNTLKNGDIRVLCYSPALTAISGHEGALLTFDVTATAAVNDDITVDGIELVTTGCQTVKLDAFAIGVNTATSVNETAIGKDIACIEYFNLAGQRITEPTTGVTLVVTTYTDGTRTTTKLIK